MRDYNNSPMGYVIEIMLLHDELIRKGKIVNRPILKSELKKIIIDIALEFKSSFDIDWWDDNGYELLMKFAEPRLIKKFNQESGSNYEFNR